MNQFCYYGVKLVYDYQEGLSDEIYEYGNASKE